MKSGTSFYRNAFYTKNNRHLIFFSNTRNTLSTSALSFCYLLHFIFIVFLATTTFCITKWFAPFSSSLFLTSFFFILESFLALILLALWLLKLFGDEVRSTFSLILLVPLSFLQLKCFSISNLQSSGSNDQIAFLPFISITL